jgi:hypothetical protein
MAMVESALAAVPMLPSVRFLRAARRTRRASFHATGSPLCVCRQAGLARIQELGIWAPRHRYRVIGTLQRLNSSSPSAEGRTQRPLRPVWCRRTSFHLQRCGSPCATRSFPASSWCV